MARKARPARGAPEDLEAYEVCRADAEIGVTPLAVGWLQPGRAFDTGETPAGFLEALLPFCREPHTVCRSSMPLRCPLCRETDVLPGETKAAPRLAEIRVIGEMEIFAGPTLIYHYVAAHGYCPPEVFIEAVMKGPEPGSETHRALVRTLQALS